MFVMCETDVEKELTPHALKLLAALRESHEVWMSRRDVAEAIGKNRLTPYDIELLLKIAELGLGEARQIVIKGVVHSQYRAIEVDSDG